jgi:SNF2 family DNA or RNA helicase
MQERHFRVEAAFQGTNIYTGPQVDHCHTLMNMERVATHGPTDEYPLSKCHELPTCKATFLDCQINGAAWMLMRTFGQIPMSNDRLNAITAASQERSRYIETLRKKHVAVETRGGILGDGTGMGKTFTTLLYLSYQARHIAEFHTSMNKYTPDHKFAHKPSLILAPSSTVLVQWADLVSKLFPNLYLVVGFGDTAPKPALARSFVKSAAMREFEAGKPESLKRWPEHLKFMWDQNDPKASSVVILTTYDTISERIVSIREQEASEPEGKKEKILANRWKGCIETVVMDEGHKVRHPRTKIHTMVKRFRARSHWFITATPTVNSVLVCTAILIWRLMLTM